MKENQIDVLISRIMDVTGIRSQAELAKELGINRSGITHARNKNRIPDNWLIRLYRRYKLNPEWIEAGTGQVFLNTRTNQDVLFKQIPKVEARLSAGTGSFECEQGVSEYLSFQASWLSRKGSAASMVAMEVFGRSMEPVINEGDTVLIDQAKTQIIAGAIYAVGVDDTILVKRIEKLPGKLALVSDNKDFQPILISMDDAIKVRILGKVIWSCREYL